jgi:O-antigen ligase
MQANPVLGAGYECFWLGPRLLRVWQQFGGLNEAHNGYLEVYLNLGIAGLFLLSVFLIASYRTICRRLSHYRVLPLSVWPCGPFLSCTTSLRQASEAV